MNRQTIGIIGAGKMGSDLFYSLMESDFNVFWFCRTDSYLIQIEKFIRKLNKYHAMGILNDIRFMEKKNSIRITNNIHDLKDCNIIIEVITEDKNKKAELFKILDENINENCIFTSNSSSIDPVLLIPSERRREKFAGLHFFYPVKLKDIVEINVTKFTSTDTIAELKKFLTDIRKEALVLEGNNHFLLNKIFVDPQAEAFRIIMHYRASWLEIENIIKDGLFPAGIFEMFEQVGIDIMLTSINNYLNGSDNNIYYLPMLKVLKEMIETGILGTKTNNGFYTIFKNSSLNDLKSGDRGDIFNRMQVVYLNSYKKFLKRSGICGTVLNNFLKEYSSVEEGPAEMIEKIGIDKLNNMFDRYFPDKVLEKYL